MILSSRTRMLRGVAAARCWHCSTRRTCSLKVGGSPVVCADPVRVWVAVGSFGLPVQAQGCCTCGRALTQCGTLWLFAGRVGGPAGDGEAVLVEGGRRPGTCVARDLGHSHRAPHTCMSTAPIHMHACSAEPVTAHNPNPIACMRSCCMAGGPAASGTCPSTRARPHTAWVAQAAC